jgi:hypothetical protein
LEIGSFSAKFRFVGQNFSPFVSSSYRYIAPHVKRNCKDTARYRKASTRVVTVLYLHSLLKVISQGRSFRLPEIVLSPDPVLSVRFLVRSISLFGTFYLAEKSLWAWYEFAQNFDYYRFAIFFVFGVLLGFSQWSDEIRRRFSIRRLFLVLGFLFFCLPWGESFHYAPASSTRGDWSRQIVHQTIFLYVALLAFTHYPGAAH